MPLATKICPFLLLCCYLCRSSKEGHICAINCPSVSFLQFWFRQFSSLIKDILTPWIKVKICSLCSMRWRSILSQTLLLFLLWEAQGLDFNYYSEVAEGAKPPSSLMPHQIYCTSEGAQSVGTAVLPTGEGEMSKVRGRCEVRPLPSWGAESSPGWLVVVEILLSASLVLIFIPSQIRGGQFMTKELKLSRKRSQV